MDEKTITNLRDAGCCDAFIDELSGLPSACARICRLKTYRRELLERVHAEQKDSRPSTTSSIRCKKPIK